MPLFQTVSDLRFQTPELSGVAVVDFTGGLQLTQRPAQNELQEACNVDINADGTVCRRKPVTAFGEGLPSKPCNMYFFENREGFGDPPFPRVFVTLENGEVWSHVYMDDGTISTEGPFPGIPATDGNCYRGHQVNFRQYFFNVEESTVCVDGLTQTVFPWTTSPDYVPFDPVTGTGGTAGATPGMPEANYMEVCGGFAFAADVIDPVTGERNCNRLWRSYPLQEGNGAGEQFWGENDWVDIDPGNDGDCITGMLCCGDRMYVFKSHSIYEVTNFESDENIAVTQFCSDVGVANCDAVVCCDCDLYFFDPRRGLYVIDEDLGLQYAFDKLESLLDDRKLNCLEMPELVRVGCCEGKIMVSVPSAGSDVNDVTYVLDPRVGEGGTWSKYDFGVCSFLDVCPSEYKVKGTCLAVTDRCNHVVSLNTTTDEVVDDFGCGTEEIYTKILSGFYDGGNPFSTKKWCTPEWIVEGDGDITVSVNLDYDTYCDTVAVAGDTSPKDCTATLERLTPDAEPTMSACSCGSCAAFDDPCVGDKYKVCGPTLDCEGCVLQLCFEGPTDQYWCLCGVLVLFRPEPLRC